MVEGARLEIVWAVSPSREFESPPLRQIYLRRTAVQDSIFTKIINGEIPCHKIYEDDKTFAFLDIFPTSPGHTLVIPKIQIDKIYDLPDDYYAAVFETGRKLAKNMETVLGKRTFYKVMGVDVPHAHLQLISEGYIHDRSQLKQASDQELSEMTDKLRIND